MLENLSNHKSERVRDLIEPRGARREFLTPCCPGLNSIEMVFSKIKPMLRTLAGCTRRPLWASIQSALDAVPPHDAGN